MTDIECLDYRRTDLRTNVLEGPYWLTSAEIGIACDDLVGILFSFPAAVYTRERILIHAIICQITTDWAGGTITLEIGSHTLATEAITTGDDATIVDTDEYIKSADITSATSAFYPPASSDYLTAIAAQTWAGVDVITPADATVPCITVTLSSTDTLTAGAARVHALISELPGV